MAIFNFSMREKKYDSSIKQYLFEANWKELMLAASQPEKIFHFVDLVYNGEQQTADNDQQTADVNLINFKPTDILFKTDNPNQYLILDIGILNNLSLSRKFKFVGISCEPGHDALIDYAQCQSVDGIDYELQVDKKIDIDNPRRVIVAFKMPPEQALFKFYILLDDITDDKDIFFHKIDPGVGSGPPGH